MNAWQIAFKSFRHYWRTNLAVIFGVAIATAVLTGALIVGESMRGSLKALTLDRLGQIDEVLVSDGFFRAELAEELSKSDVFQKSYSQAVPAILFPNGSVESRFRGTDQSDTNGQRLRANNVNVIAVGADFWKLGDPPLNVSISGGGVAINEQLAVRLLDQIEFQQPLSKDFFETLVLRIPKPTQLPSESALGKTDDLVESLVDLTVDAILPDEGLARFGLHPSQIDAPNIFVPIEMLQESLCRGALEHKGQQALANVIFLAGSGNAPPSAETTEAMLASLRPQMEDFGLAFKNVKIEATQPDGEAQEPIAEYWSLASDRLVLSNEAVQSAAKAFPSALPVFTYLANSIGKANGETQDTIPYSMVTAIEFGSDFAPESAETGQPIQPLADDEIVLNSWAADNLGAKIGDTIEIKFFEPETTHGNQIERTQTFKLADIAKITTPAEPFQVLRRYDVVPAVFTDTPTLANDPDLTPEVPGVTDSESIENWDLPFQTKGKIRPADDEYWNNFRTTPKAFVNLSSGRKLWASRFGNTTSLRIPKSAGAEVEIENRLLQQFVDDQTRLGFELIPLKRNGLAAASGSTPFDVLFLALSMFVIASALILVSLLFRLGLQSRAAEIGLLEATGFESSTIFGLWIREMILVCAIGAVLGVALGIGYAALMVLGLTTWWVGAISKPIITMHVGPTSLLIGLFAGVSICVATIWWSLRRTRKEPVRSLLSGQLESDPVGASAVGKRSGWLAGGLLVGGLLLSVVASQLSGDAQAGAFMGSGFFVLIALLTMVYRWLRKPATSKIDQLDLKRLATISGRRNPLRSTLTIGLVAVASFLIAAVSSFRLAPTEQGTAGFQWIAESSQPIFADLNSAEDQSKLLGRENQLAAETKVYSMRLKPGEDASCNNLYQSTQPRVLAVTREFTKRFNESDNASFAWASTTAQTDAEKKNPWQLLNQATDDGSIPCVIDKNTANYSLKIFAVGGNFTAEYDSGETVTFRVVGFLANTVLQGSLIVAEDAFVQTFPTISGYRYFLIDDGGQPSVVMTLEDRLGDQGFDARSAEQVLSGFMQVQNTYLNTFQALGALGLLFGTFGLAAVQIRNVIQRKQELGLMRAVGFTKQRLSQMVLLENAWLLFLGLGVGVLSALCATLPHYFVGSASMPWGELGIMFGLIVVVGLFAAWIASRQIGKVPLLESLRA